MYLFGVMTTQGTGSTSGRSKAWIAAGLLLLVAVTVAVTLALAGGSEPKPPQVAPVDASVPEVCVEGSERLMERVADTSEALATIEVAEGQAELEEALEGAWMAYGDVANIALQFRDEVPLNSSGGRN